MEEMQSQQASGGIVVALAGNPNSGKTTLFNELTGSRQHVGNWPGVTVEKKEGRMFFAGQPIQIVDLPGTYSLGAYSEDEAVARNYIVFDKPDVVVNIIDAVNIERNLYLTVQLLEMGANVVIALNMIDEAQARQVEVRAEKLSTLLGIPVVPTVATKNHGVKELIEQVVAAAKCKKNEALRINYGREMEAVLEAVISEIKRGNALNERFDPRWLAVNLLTGDLKLIEGLVNNDTLNRLLLKQREYAKNLEQAYGDDVETIVAEKRYGFISGLAKEVVVKRQSVADRLTMSDRIDKIVTNRYLGIPIFLLLMWAMFQFTFTLGDPMIEWIETLFEWLGEAGGSLLESAGASELMKSFFVDGLIGGIGSVLVFMPNILLLFFAISLLEDSGYMARAAYVMDRFMHSLGLHGKSFIPMLMGFGCNVPAIMATRTLENKQDRLITILINPLMSCSARLPVYVLFVGAFFSAYEGLVIFSLYMLGIVMAIFIGMLFKRFLFKGETSHFVMELPPYRIPTLKSTFIHMWERSSSFIRKAGTIIFAVGSASVCSGRIWIMGGVSSLSIWDLGQRSSSRNTGHNLRCRGSWVNKNYRSPMDAPRRICVYGNDSVIHPLCCYNRCY